MSIVKTAQTKAALISAFNTILEHTGPTPEVSNYLDIVISLCLREIRRLVDVSPAVAFAVGATGAANLTTQALAVAGKTFTINATTDSSDTLLTTAKGTAIAVGDLFVVTGSGATVAYVSSGVADADVSFDPYTYVGIQQPALA